MRSQISPYTFAARLRTARETRGLSQQELAENVSLHRDMISHLEGGKRNPSVDTLKLLAGGLDVTTDFLLGRTEDMQPARGYEQIRQHLGRLSADDLEVIEKLCAFLAQRSDRNAGEKG